MTTSFDSVKLRFSEKFGYGLGDLASCLFWQTFSIYLANFYTDVFGLTAAAVATMLLATRTWDLGFDIVMGALSDRTSTRWGKFRPYLVWIPIPLGIAMILTYTTPDLSLGGKLVYAYITYGVLMMLYSAVNVPYAALLGVMTTRAQERNSLSSFRMIGAFAGSLFVSWTMYGLIYYFSVDGTPFSQVLSMAWTSMTQAFSSEAREAASSFQVSVLTPSGYRSAVVVYSVMAVFVFLGTFLLTKEKVAPKQQKNPSIKKDIADLMKNIPWWILVVVTVLKQAFSGVRTGMIVYYFKYYVGNEPLSAMYLIVGQLASIVGIIAVGYLPARYGKKMPYIVSILGAGVFSLASFWVSPTNFGLMFTYQVLINFFMGPPTAMLWSLYGDAADYSELKTGRRSTGLVFSASGMSQKLGSTIASSVGLYLLGYYAFKANEAQTPETLHGLNMLVSVIPALCCFGCAIAMAFFPLNAKRMEEIEDGLRVAREKEAGSAA